MVQSVASFVVDLMIAAMALNHYHDEESLLRDTFGAVHKVNPSTSTSSARFYLLLSLILLTQEENYF